MKLLHLGIEIDITPRQATVENRIVRMLYKHRCGVRQTKLFAGPKRPAKSSATLLETQAKKLAR